MLSQAPLPGGRRETHQQSGYCEANGARERRFTATPTPNLFRCVDGARVNRFVSEHAAKFIRQCLRGLVTARRLFLQALERDGLQISGDRRIQQTWQDWLRIEHLRHDVLQ